MKYPPLCSAHWEGAVGQWLRGQLDARGIDALAYGRYVLSLLTRPLDPADLSPSPIGNKNWERRNQSDWAPVKIEALKRSAAVQCLINATDDQNSGIEELVDELCSKLKEVENINDRNGRREVQAMKPSRKERPRPLSPREMARLYYAAFPALVPLNSASEPIPPSFSDGSGLLSNNQKNKNIVPHKHNTSGNKDCVRSKKSHLSKERHNTGHSYRNQNHCHGNGHKHRKSRKSHCNTENLPEWVNNGDVWDIESQEHMQDLIKGIDEGYGTCDNTVVDEIPSSKRLYERDADPIPAVDGNEFIFSKWDNEDVHKSLQKSPSEDESMAKFKAKFDRSLEALWPKEQNNNIDYELPLDFLDISSPSDRMFDCYSTDRPLPLSLTSSIWSNNDSKSDWEANELSVNENSNSHNFTSEDKEISFVPTKQNNPWHGNDTYNKETMEVIYNKLKPLNLDDDDEKSYEIKSKTHAQLNQLPSCFSKRNDDYVREPFLFSFKVHQPPIGTPARSLNILNHSSYSSFSEVVPKVGSGLAGSKNNDSKFDFPDPPIFPDEVEQKEDEDLLTSMRTHFRPIKHDSQDPLQNTVNYADGMTFPIVSDLDIVQFNRSSTGSIFLESDNEPPKRYMEYRKQGIDYARLDISSSSVCSDDSMYAKDLILKFKVCQNEKSIQTDAFDGVQGFANPSLSSPLLPNIQERTTYDLTTKNNTDPDKELESLDVNWMQCDECKSNNNQWGTDTWNSSKIWSANETFCKTCAEQTDTKVTHCNSVKDKVYEEETAREWDELYSDIRYIHDLKSDGDWVEDLNTPSENCYITPNEISIKAVDGNFIKSALLAKRSNAEDVRSWLRGTEGKTDSNVVGKILDHSLIMYGNPETRYDGSTDVNDMSAGWRIDRKRRHSAVSGGRVRGVGKQRCTLPGQDSVYINRPVQMPLLPATADRPLTR